MLTLTLLLVGAGLLALSKNGKISTPTPVVGLPANVGPVAVATPLLPAPIQAILQGGIEPQNGYPWPPAPGAPGSVMIGGQQAPHDYSLGNMNTAIKSAGIAETGLGLISGVAHGITEITGTAVLPALGAAIPIIGAGIAAIGIVLGIIAKHHAEAVAREATILAQATPIMRQRQVLITQAAIVGEINYQQAVALVAEAIADFYKMLHPIQRGTWHWNAAYNDSSAGFWPKGMDQHSPNAHAPDPCNAACWYGHFAAEGDCYTVVLPTIQKILAKQHGTMRLSNIPPNSGEKGFPEILVLY